MSTKEKNGCVSSRVHKLKVLGKLIENGYKTENDLKALDLEQILNIKGITLNDIAIIVQFQKHVKSNTFYTYIAQDCEEPNI